MPYSVGQRIKYIKYEQFTTATGVIVQIKQSWWHRLYGVEPDSYTNFIDWISPDDIIGLEDAPCPPKR